MSQNDQNIYFQNKNVPKRDIRINIFADLGHFGSCLIHFWRFWAKTLCCMSYFGQNLFSENEFPCFWDIKPPTPGIVACPILGKTFFPKMSFPVLGT